jgi:hypothetical protein
VMAKYDLGEMGLAWRKGIGSDPLFIRLTEEIRARFATL